MKISCIERYSLYKGFFDSLLDSPEKTWDATTGWSATLEGPTLHQGKSDIVQVGRPGCSGSEVS